MAVVLDFRTAEIRAARANHERRTRLRRAARRAKARLGHLLMFPFNLHDQDDAHDGEDQDKNCVGAGFGDDDRVA